MVVQRLLVSKRVATKWAEALMSLAFVVSVYVLIQPLFSLVCFVAKLIGAVYPHFWLPTLRNMGISALDRHEEL